jgi:hypothetical protein
MILITKVNMTFILFIKFSLIIIAVQNMVIDSINKCNIDKQSVISKHVVLSGGKFLEFNFQLH